MSWGHYVDKFTCPKDIVKINKCPRDTIIMMECPRDNIYVTSSVLETMATLMHVLGTIYIVGLVVRAWDS